MSVRCAVCNNSFKESHALQMHQAAKGHNVAIVGMASGVPISVKRPQKNPNLSKSAPSAAGTSSTSGIPGLCCVLCGRFFMSQNALAAHAEAKNHFFADTAKVLRLEKSPLRCSICGRGGFLTAGALSDHKRDSKNHQTQDLQEAPREAPTDTNSNPGHSSRLNDLHSSTLMVDKMVQCNLCSCEPSGVKTGEIDLVARLREGDKQQNPSRSDLGDQSHQLNLEYRPHGGTVSTCQFGKTFTDLKNCVMEATNQQPTLAKEANRDNIQPVNSPNLINQATLSGDLLDQHSTSPQIPSDLADVEGVTRLEPLKHLGKEWSLISLSEQPLALEILRNLCHPVLDLEKGGYRTRHYTLAGLLEQRRCKICKSMFLNVNIPTSSLIHSRAAKKYSKK